jgi:hypothetical protein
MVEPYWLTVQYLWFHTQHQGCCVFLTHTFDVTDKGNLIAPAFERSGGNRFFHGVMTIAASAAGGAGRPKLHAFFRAFQLKQLTACSIEQRAFTSAKVYEAAPSLYYHGRGTVRVHGHCESNLESSK